MFRCISSISYKTRAAYLVLGSILNTITPSKAERRLWLPIILLLLASSLVVALLAP